jgi:CP family cyanate transporter-like MFS transporter
LIPWLTDRSGVRHRFLTVFGVAFAGGLLGLALAPSAGWFFAVLAGTGIGVLFPLVLTLPLDAADRPADVGALVGLMLGAGYCISAVAPFALGAIRDATGSFTAVLWIVFALTVLLLISLLPLTPARLRRVAPA